MNTNKIKNRINILNNQHKALDHEIKVSYNTYNDDSLIKTLKQKKLMIKDQLKELQEKLNGK